MKRALQKPHAAASTPINGLTCEQARCLLPAFVEAERAGKDVDTAREYAALLRHLDQCSECMELYVGLSEDLDALIGPDESLPEDEDLLS